MKNSRNSGTRGYNSSHNRSDGENSEYDGNATETGRDAVDVKEKFISLFDRGRLLFLSFDDEIFFGGLLCNVPLLAGGTI